MRIGKLIAATALSLALISCGGKGEGELPKGEALPKIAAPAGKQWTEVVSKTAEGFRMGNPEAKVQLVEYGAITCPGCAAFSVQSTEELNGLVNGGNLNFEFRPFMVHGVQDMPGFLLAQCNGPEAFFPMIEAMYADQPTWLNRINDITEAEKASLGSKTPSEVAKFLADKFQLVDFVKARGLAEDKANSCLADKAALDALVKITEEAGKSGLVTGTPTLLLNGNKTNMGSWAELRAAIKNSGAR